MAAPAIMEAGERVPYRRWLLNRWKELKAYRDETVLQHWRELADFFLPRRARFQQDHGGKNPDTPRRNTNLINNGPRRAARTLAAGMMAGITSPARPWFRLLTPDRDLGGYRPVKSWLYTVEERIRLQFAKSNFYRGGHTMYGDMGVFGVSPLFLDFDPEDILRCYSWPVGTYALATSYRGRVDTAMREYTMTTAQLVENFGLDRLSKRARECWDRSKYYERFNVLHAVTPNRNREWVGGRPMAGYRGMPFKSCWLELNEDDQGDLLEERGFEDFPVIAPRWEPTGESVYSESCPGIDALGAAMALQKVERRKGQLLGKVTMPPTQFPAALLRKKTTLGENDKVFVPSTATGQRVETIYAPQPGALEWAFRYSSDFRQQVFEDFYTDLFLMISNLEDPTRTATEIVARNEERMMQVGPVVEGLTDEALDPAVMRNYNLLLRNGQIPPPPPELEDQELRIEYTSILTQAQKLLGAAGMERFLAFAGQMAGVAAGVTQAPVLRGIDFNELRDAYADVLGIPPNIIRDQAEVDEELAAEAQRAEQERQGQMALAAAQGAKDLASAKLDEPSALTAMLQQQVGPRVGGPVPQIPPNLMRGGGSA